MLHFTPNALNLFANPKQFEQMIQTTLGFDTMFERLLGDDQHFNRNQSGYPPYNLKRDGEHYIIELAVAGLSEEDIKVNVEDGVLTVESTTKDKESGWTEDEFIHEGIAKRSFKRSWTLSDDIVVKGASLDNGMLTISMEKIIPEEKKAKQIPIVTSQKNLS